jgi:lipid-A-disaccharide synthase
VKNEALRIFLVAGEPSGDVLGGRLMAALKNATNGDVEFMGVGGPAMQAQGLKSLFPMTELSVMGIVEILPHARLLFRRMRETAAAIDQASPDAVVTIDAPAFAHGVAKRIRNSYVPRIHYVAPQLWAWRPWRVHKFKRHFHHLLALLPFEPAWFARHGVDCRFVGHPVVESEIADADGTAFRAHHGIDSDALAICVLPGSRKGEVSRLSEPFRETLVRLQERYPDLIAIIPTIPNVSDAVRNFARDLPLPAIVTDDPSEKYSAMAACNVGLAASGTVTLELSLAGVPYVVGYRLSPITWYLAKPLFRIPYANLINLTVRREVVPEFLQSKCCAAELCGGVSKLIEGDGDLQVKETVPALEEMGLGGPPPSHRAAQAVLEIVQKASTG